MEDFDYIPCPELISSDPINLSIMRMIRTGVNMFSFSVSGQMKQITGLMYSGFHEMFERTVSNKISIVDLRKGSYDTTWGLYYLVTPRKVYVFSDIVDFSKKKDEEIQKYLGSVSFAIPNIHLSSVDDQKYIELIKTMVDACDRCRLNLNTRLSEEQDHILSQQGLWFVWDDTEDDGERFKQIDYNANWNWWYFEGHVATTWDLYYKFYIEECQFTQEKEKEINDEWIDL